MFVRKTNKKPSNRVNGQVRDKRQGKPFLNSFYKQMSGFIGVLVVGFLLGRPGHEALVPSQWIASLLGENSVLSNFFAAIAGACMYFATLTEIPIVQGLLGSGMAQGPALALLLAGPSLSLPSMLIIGSELGMRKNAAYVVLVVLLSTLAGLLYSIFI